MFVVSGGENSARASTVILRVVTCSHEYDSEMKRLALLGGPIIGMPLPDIHVAAVYVVY
jgi:hypothetical protein